MAASRKKPKAAAAPPAHRAGFCAIIGRPNVGKSTFLNRALGQKLAIVSPKPQTTRNRLLGVLTRPEVQLAFFDTPGIHRAKGGLNRFMVDQALSVLPEVDVVLYLIEPGVRREGQDASGFDVEIGEAERFIVDRLARSRKPVVLGINKIDALKQKAQLLPVIAAWKDVLPFGAVMPLSALGGEGVEEVIAELARHLPEGPQMFPEDVLTDAAERFLVAEFVREQIVRHTRQEIPYASAVEVEEFDETEREGRGLVRISCKILVERDSQKAIVIGKKGAMLKKVGTDARRSIEQLLGCRVFLSLHVSVEPRWSESESALRKLGYT